MTTEHKNFAERLNQALDLRNYPSIGRGRISYIQELFDISRSGANKWLHGKVLPHLKARRLIAEKLGVNLIWLETGEGSPLDKDNVGFSPDNLVHAIPLLTMQQAGNYEEVIKTGNNIESLIVKNLVPKSSIAITNVGSAMEPKFSEGCILVIDLNAKISDGDYVIAYTKMLPEAIFRQYIKGAGGNYLVALNSKFEPIRLNTDDRIIGKVIEARSTL